MVFLLEREWERENERIRREDARADKRAALQDRFLSESLPRILTVAQGAVDAINAQRRAGSNGVKPPDGVEAMACANCNGTMFYVTDQNHIVCAHCSATYANEPGESGDQGVSGAPGPSDAPEVG